MHSLKLSANGWHGIIADTFSFKNLKTIAEAYGYYLLSQRKTTVVIAYDQGFNQELFADYFSQILLTQGLTVKVFAKAAPTAVLRFAIKHEKASAGVMFAAAALPFSYGGVQLYDQDAKALSAQAYRYIHDSSVSLSQPNKTTQAKLTALRIDVSKDYFKHIAAFVDFEKLRKLKGKILYASKNQLAFHYLEAFSAEYKLALTFVSKDFYPASALETQSAKSEQTPQEYLFELKTNSDASQLSLATPAGRTITRHQLSYFLFDYLHQRGLLDDSLTKVDYGSAQNLLWARTASGFKTLFTAFLSGDLIANSSVQQSVQQSALLTQFQEDAVFNLLYLLNIMAQEKLSLAELITKHSSSAFHQEAVFETDWRKSYGSDQYLIRTKRLPKKLIANLPENLANHKINSVINEQDLTLMLENNACLRFKVNPLNESPKNRSSLVMQCQASSREEVQYILRAARGLVKEIVG